jgi:hypothetical protein
MDKKTTTSSPPAIAFVEDNTRAIDLTDDIQDSAFAQRPYGSSVAATASLPESITANWSRIAKADMSLGMFNRLVRLAAQPGGWRGPGSAPLQPSSLSRFLTFWTIVRDEAKEPELTLAPDGTLHAEWFRSEKQRLDIGFSDPKIVFGMITGNSILEGAENLITVAQILRHHQARPFAWGSR